MKKQITKILFFLATFLILPGYVFASPIVSGVSGTIADGQNITILGSGFGMSGPNVLFFDNFEGGVIGQDLKTGTSSATIGQWSSLGRVHPKYSNDTSISGTKAWKVTASLGVEDSANALIMLPNINEVFISYWWYVPLDSPWSGEGLGSYPPNMINWKIMWMMQNNSVNSDMMMPVRVGNYWYISGNDTPYTRELVGINAPTVSKGLWKKFWFWIKDGSSNDGAVRWWELINNGVKTLVADNNVSTIRVGDVRKKLFVNGYTRQHDSGTMPTQMFDDIYVATGPNAQARVEIGNVATYLSSTNLAVSTINNWSDTSISATVRSGNFTSGQAYLYVVDANGNVNANGYPITFGGGMSPDTTPPTAPTGLQVN